MWSIDTVARPIGQVPWPFAAPTATTGQYVHTPSASPFSRCPAFSTVGSGGGSSNAAERQEAHQLPRAASGWPWSTAADKVRKEKRNASAHRQTAVARFASRHR